MLPTLVLFAQQNLRFSPWSVGNKCYLHWSFLHSRTFALHPGVLVKSVTYINPWRVWHTPRARIRHENQCATTWRASRRAATRRAHQMFEFSPESAGRAKTFAASCKPSCTDACRSRCSGDYAALQIDFALRVNAKWRPGWYTAFQIKIALKRPCKVTYWMVRRCASKFRSPGTWALLLEESAWCRVRSVPVFHLGVWVKSVTYTDIFSHRTFVFHPGVWVTNVTYTGPFCTAEPSFFTLECG